MQEKNGELKLLSEMERSNLDLWKVTKMSTKNCTHSNSFLKNMKELSKGVEALENKIFRRYTKWQKRKRQNENDKITTKYQL